MDEKNCPRCQAEITNNAPLYQCCRCFTYYCKKCEATNEGKNCPKCRMGARLIISSGK